MMGSRRPSTVVLALVVTVLCVGQAASAAPSMGGGNAGEAVVLYDQYNNPGSGSIPSQDNDPPFDDHDSLAADDFVVPGGQAWMISGVDVEGLYGGTVGTTASINVFFYTNGAGNLPGTLIASRPGQAYVQGPANGDFVVTLSPTVGLSSGTYWVSVQAGSSSIQWFWLDRTVQSNAGAVFENPGNGWGTGCTTWTRITTLACFGAQEPDLVFRLNGTVLPTSVRVIEFGARSTARGVIVDWRTAAAAEVVGFELWRQQGTGAFRKLSRALIPAEPGVRAARYSFLDSHARQGGLYRYRLRLVTLSGARYWVGGATARVPG